MGSEGIFTLLPQFTDFLYHRGLFCLYEPDDWVALCMLCDIIKLDFPPPSSLLFCVFYIFCTFVSRWFAFGETLLVWRLICQLKPVTRLNLKGFVKYEAGWPKFWSRVFWSEKTYLLFQLVQLTCGCLLCYPMMDK